jgi:hypothetical protein
MKPKTSTVVLRGRKIELEGQVAKGDRLTLELEVRVGGVHFDDKVDSGGDVTGTTRKHVLFVEGVRRSPNVN